MRQTAKLTAVRVAKEKEPGRYGDGLGLWLQVARGGTKSWLFRYQRDGRAREMGLGPCHTVTLAEAREKATDCRRALLAGVDPIEARKSAREAGRLEDARSISFQSCAEQYIAAHKAGWKNAKHAAQWTATLETYVYPIFGALSAAAVDTALVTKALEPIWSEKAETAGRVRGRIEVILDWAAARGYRSPDNPARWRGHLDKLLPPRRKVSKVKHHAAMPYSEVPAFMAKLRQRKEISARALEFCILTVTRTGETIGAKWTPEIALKAKLWTVPPERMKTEREHRVPLSKRAMEILKSLPQEGEYVFPGAKEKRPLSNMAMLEMLHGMGYPHLTVHGFRSSFRDWAAETTSYPNEVVEMALAHVVRDKTEAAYRRGDLFEKRRQLSRDWADFCASTPRKPRT